MVRAERLAWTGRRWRASGMSGWPVAYAAAAARGRPERLAAGGAERARTAGWISGRHFSFNCALAGYTDGVQRFMISERDKYGQGRVSGTMPVARGEEWELVGAEQVWLMRLGS